MSHSHDMNRHRYLDLLVLEATYGLEEAQAHELCRLRRTAGVPGDDLLAATTGLLDVAYEEVFDAEVELPTTVREQILSGLSLDTRSQQSASVQVEAEVEAEPHAPRKPTPLRWIPLAASAVAALLLLGVLVFGAPGTPTLDERYDRLKARATVAASWQSAGDPAYDKVQGEIIWDDATQRGYMLLSGLPANDPKKAQYQLWIVDPDRDARPVDGGVFDVPAGSDRVIIPIDAKLPVKEPAVFAITSEQPGGVVVSAGPHLVVAKRS